MARHGKGAKIRLRLYMEGRLVENALDHVQVSGHTGAPATAQLSLVPTNTIKHVLPGTWVHVFATDPWELDPAGDLSDFKLLFEGVVVGRGFTRADDGRSFTIQCADPSVYWVHARQFWLNITSPNGGLVDQLAIQTSGGYGRFVQVKGQGPQYMVGRLGLEKDQGEERFMDTMISVIDDIGNVNPFYTNARNRFRLTDRILRGNAGQTEKLFQLALLSDFIDGLAGRQSTQTNLAQVVNQLLTAILHEWVSVPAPPYVNTRIFSRDVFGNIKRKKTTVKRRDRKGQTKSDLFEFETADDDIVASLIFKPHVYTLAPPTCNVLFPNMYDSLGYNEDFMQETTRLQMQPQLPTVLDPQRKLTQGLYITRPSELEIFIATVQDSAKNKSKQRTPDGRFADGASQAPTFGDYDWTTNEERIRGIVYNFINLAPAPSTLTLQGQGERKPTGSRKGGVPKYLQNVASYEYYKSKFMARQASMSGPLNMRPIPGFPILALDDSQANMNMVAYLDAIVHSIDAKGSGTTQYSIRYPRHTDEVDFNRPRFKQTGDPFEGELDFDLYRDENGNYDFGTLFDGVNQPPVPEWFDETFRSLRDLDIKYSSWFGENVGVVHNVLFTSPEQEEIDEIARQEGARFDDLLSKGINPLDGVNVPATLPDGTSVPTAKDALDEALRDDILEGVDEIGLHDAVMELNKRYLNARDTGREFEEASSFTARSFTKIDEAFRFVGAAPLEFADKAKNGDDTGRASFNNDPAAARVINYKTARLDHFIGDTSFGSGYSAERASKQTSSPTTTATDSAGDTSTGESPPSDRMSGAFPVFDTNVHTGDQALDKETRDALLNDGEERKPSDRARYDGRPVMFDFEFRLWQESLRQAGFSPTREKVGDAAAATQYFAKEGGQFRPATAEELAASAAKRKATLERRMREEETRTKRGRTRPSKRNMTPKRQAPTGDGLEQEQKDALPQPLSEKQVIDLRRSVVDAYRDELARTRGFTG